MLINKHSHVEYPHCRTKVTACTPPHGVQISAHTSRETRTFHAHTRDPRTLHVHFTHCHAHFTMPRLSQSGKTIARQSMLVEDWLPHFWFSLTFYKLGLVIVRNVAFQQRRRYETATMIRTTRKWARALTGIYQNRIRKELINASSIYWLFTHVYAGSPYF